jgi:hypothetical protein
VKRLDKIGVVILTAWRRNDYSSAERYLGFDYSLIIACS